LRKVKKEHPISQSESPAPEQPEEVEPVESVIVEPRKVEPPEVEPVEPVGEKDASKSVLPIDFEAGARIRAGVGLFHGARPGAR
jgi:hypothetical protein